ncbi:ParB N-terminal domain-containing protein [Streptomyces sp. NBC_00669]|uniref:ParB/RepB/Spo0J family partition protein n=1 Tax=unclassified Streptomyces TaxID=2593676 RepID=UPI002E376C5C|nr:ParB N-terminal domain-containing protein [Streptomyces sp. NBC_00669]
MTEVEVDALRLAGSPRLAGERQEHVEILAAASNPLPPIIVHRPTMRVIDGFHRLRAARLRGDTTIAARFFEGDESAAFVLAVQLNVTHGLPLALADRQRAAERIIDSHPHWSDRRVATVTGIAPGTVSEIRRRLAPGTADPDERRLGQDGRMRPLNGSAGRLRAGELLTEQPELSLRQVARAAGISPETARDVRNRLRNGEPLLPRSYRRDQDAEPDPHEDSELVPTIPVQVKVHVQSESESDSASRPARTPHTEPATLRLARAVRRARADAAPDRVVLVKRLTADPALRFSETGRTLLRLLAIHAVREEEWEAIIGNVPPHCSGIVADLAVEVAEMWEDFATRVRRDIAASAG